MASASPSRFAGAAEAAAREPSRPHVRSAAIAALRRRFAALRPDIELSPTGYVSRLEKNLLPGVEARHFAEDFALADGHELSWKICAVHSSAALAVNTFARFKPAPEHLSLAGLTGFRNVSFERQCSIGLRGGRPANLDLVAEGPGGVVAVESKCTEHLHPTAPRFSPAYAEQIRDERRNGAWFRAMELLRAQPAMFQLLDAAQLVKHAFGLARCFPGRPVILLYLYWEPTDPERHPTFRQHQREVERFARLLAGGFPAFQAHSYPDLWNTWEMAVRPDWLRGHLANVRGRYEVPVGR